MTPPRHRDDRRIGFSLDAFGRPRSLSRDGAWSDDVRHEARWAYLQVLTRLYPLALFTLDSVPRGDDAALTAWLRRWGLMTSDPDDDWTRAHAQATMDGLDAYHPRPRCWFDRDDLAGRLVTGPNDAPVESLPLRHAAHFTWLAQFQAGRGWVWIAHEHYAGVTSVRLAVPSLAADLRLTLRSTRRGRPRSRQ